MLNSHRPLTINYHKKEVSNFTDGSYTYLLGWIALEIFKASIPSLI